MHKKTITDLQSRAEAEARDKGPAAYHVANKQGVQLEKARIESWFVSEVMERIAATDPAYRHLKGSVYA